MRLHLASVSAVCCAVAAAGVLANPVVGTTETFSNGEINGWTNGLNPDPLVLPGGPGGAGDNYLRVTSDGSGAGGKLTVFNVDEAWNGNWYSSGVTHVAVDFRNFDPQGRTLFMRMSFLMSAGPGQPGFCTTAYQVPADGQWHTAIFDVRPSALVRVGNPLDIDITLSGVTQVRLFHAQSPSVFGSNFASSVGIDNIRLLPSPGAAGVLMGFGLVMGRRRR